MLQISSEKVFRAQISTPNAVSEGVWSCKVYIYFVSMAKSNGLSIATDFRGDQHPDTTAFPAENLNKINLQVSRSP